MKKLLFVAATALFLTACGGSNTDQFIGKWFEQDYDEDWGEPETLTITMDSGNKVNVLHDRLIAKTQTTYRVEGDNLVHAASNQTNFTLKNGAIYINTGSGKHFKKQ